jgi:hypothetical protein
LSAGLHPLDVPHRHHARAAREPDDEALDPGRACRLVRLDRVEAGEERCEL